MQSIYIDAETFSTVPLTMKDQGVGTYNYVHHPTTVPILWAIHFDPLPRALVFENPSLYDLLMELSAARQIDRRDIELVHWGTFDRELLKAGGWTQPEDGRLANDGIDVPIRDLREDSLTYGAPGVLAFAAPFWTGAQTKDAGKALIDVFCKLDKQGYRTLPTDDPIRWEQFRSYAGQDATVLAAIDERIVAAGGHSREIHRPAQMMVRRMNERGVPIDVEAVGESIDLMSAHSCYAYERMNELCELKPTQLAKLKDVLGLPNMQADTVEQFIRVTQDPHRKEIAEIQQSVAGAAVKKLYVMNRMADDEQRVRCCFSYHGAHTRRLTSHDLQLQNFVRSPSDDAFFDRLILEDIPGDEAFREIRQNIRGYIRTEKEFYAADYKAIECRVINWLAGEQRVLEMFAAGEDPYKALAAALFRVRIEDVDDFQRQLGKIGELALGFAGGKGAVKQSASGFGIDISDRDAEEMKVTYRRTHPNVVQLWDKCDTAMRLAIDGNPVRVNGLIEFKPHPWYVQVVRPSGFSQYFWNPKIVAGFWPDGGKKHGGEIEYTGRARSGQMIRMRTYGGDIAQGVTQGVAADLMFEGMLKVEEAGLAPVMSVHDEGVFEGRPGSSLETVCQIMAMPPVWADGLPIEADGWTGRRFTKA